MLSSALVCTYHWQRDDFAEEIPSPKVCFVCAYRHRMCQTLQLAMVGTRLNQLHNVVFMSVASGRSSGSMKQLEIDDNIFIGGYKGEHNYPYVYSDMTILLVQNTYAVQDCISVRAQIR